MRLTKERPADAVGTKIDPDALYVAVQSASTSINGQPVTIREGMRLYGSDHAVAAMPSNFVPATTDDRTLARLRNHLRFGTPVPDYRGPNDPKIPRAIPAERRRVCVRSYTDRTGQWYEAGKVYDARDPFVKANPNLLPRGG